MNKKMFASIISIILIAALILSLAALMIGCRAKTDTPGSTPGNTQGSISQTINDSTADGTYDEPITDDTYDSNGDEKTDIDVPTIPSENVSLGVVEGDGPEDIDGESENSKPSGGSDSTQTKQPTQGQDNPAEIEIDIEKLTYETFWALSEKQQIAVINEFSTTEDFVKWHNYLVAQYKAEHPEIELDNSGIIDLTR